MSTRLLPLVAVLIAIGVFGYLVIDRLGHVEKRLGEVGAEVQTAARAAADAAQRSQAAYQRALNAEEGAREAAVGRQQAESSAARAEVAASAANAEVRGARAELERIQRERQAEIDRLQQVLGEVVETRRTALGLVMNLGSDAVEFEFDQATLGARERELLSRIAGILLTARGFSVFVYGHTDDVGSDAYNQTLSEHRASAVRDYLVDAGIDSNLIETRGYGKSSPIIEGTTPEARAKNRRVEIGLVDVRLDYPIDARPSP